MKVGNYWISIISHQRPGNVPLMRRLIPHATWYVGTADEEPDYIAQLGTMDVRVAGGLIASRNAALEDAFARGLWSVQISDDLRRMRRAVSQKTAVDTSLGEALGMVTEAMKATGAYLGGAAPTDNVYFANPEKPVSTRNFIVGDFIVIRPNDLRFDYALRLKEDYDYTAQHIRTYGRVARCNHLLMTFQHETNPGGAVSYRTQAMECETIAYLKAKHGNWIVDNPKRENQILLKAK